MPQELIDFHLLNNNSHEKESNVNSMGNRIRWDWRKGKPSPGENVADKYFYKVKNVFRLKSEKLFSY